MVEKDGRWSDGVGQPVARDFELGDLDAKLGCLEFLIKTLIVAAFMMKWCSITGILCVQRINELNKFKILCGITHVVVLYSSQCWVVLNQYIRDWNKIAPIVEKFPEKLLRWYGYVTWADDTSLV